RQREPDLLERQRPGVDHALVRADDGRQRERILEVDQVVQLLRGEEAGGSVQLLAVGAADAHVAATTRFHAVVENRIARAYDVEQRGRAPVVQVRRRVPQVRQDGRDVVAEPRAAGGDRP